MTDSPPKKPHPDPEGLGPTGRTPAPGQRRGLFTIQGSRVIYDNPWIELREDDVVVPGGHKTIYGVLTHKNWALGVVPIFPDLQVLLVGQHRYPHDVYSWEIPEGGGKIGADPLAEIQRELVEETGHQAEKWIPLGPVHPSNSTIDESGFLWLAEGLSAGEASPDVDEELVVKKMPLAEALGLAQQGAIFDAMSIIGLYRAAHLLHGRGQFNWPAYTTPVDAKRSLVDGPRMKAPGPREE
jgi:8-oxo-dGTP pyrophosphatase MutT (NUDIX family)